jgi:hypothetical protein
MPSEPPEAQSIGEHLEKHKWQQGAILHPKDAKRLLPETLETDVLLVISQSCDLVHLKPDEEPWVELIRATRIDNGDGNYEHFKNPRKLHMTDPNLGVLEITAIGIASHEKPCVT